MNEINGGAIPAHLMGAPASDKPQQKSMGKDDFMKLLLAQLQHQDPMNPMDHKDMSAQLAQFSSLEQLLNIGSGIQTLKSGMGEDAKLQASGLIGRRVALSGNEIELAEGQPAAMAIDRSTAYRPVKLTVYDGEGKMIRELAVTEKDAPTLSWDGKRDDGTTATPGKYSYRLVGVDNNGQAKELTGETAGKVVGIELNGKDPLLVVDSGVSRTRIELSKIKSIAMDDGSLTNPPPGARPPSPPLASRPAPAGGPPSTAPSLASGLPGTKGPNSDEARVSPPPVAVDAGGNAEERPRMSWTPGWERP